MNDALRPTPRLPAIGTAMPKSFTILVKEWDNRGLETFRDAVFANIAALSQAYNKRKYLYDTVARRRVDEGLPSLDSAARSLDRERGGASMPNFYKILHAADNTVVRRRKRRDRDPDATPPRRPPPPPPSPPPRPPAHRAPPQHRQQQRQQVQQWPAPFPPRVNRRARIVDEEPPFDRRNIPWESTGRTSGQRVDYDL